MIRNIGHNKCKRMLQKEKTDFIYMLQKLGCVICLKCKSCILIFGHHNNILHYIPLKKRKREGGLWDHRISTPPHIYTYTNFQYIQLRGQEHAKKKKKKSI